MAKKKDKEAPKPPAGPAVRTATPPRLKTLFEQTVRPDVMKQFGIGNVMAAPRIEKVVLNIGLGEASRNIKLLDAAMDELTAIAGQRPTITRAKKSIAAFKLREGMPIGCRVTLRDARMWEFLDRLINVALPRVRDFRGVSAKSFDGRGSYTLGIRDHLIFPEVDYNKTEGTKGMNVTIVTSARTDEQARQLLRALGMPFTQDGAAA
jgi:large subunit ribosomal protein L5